MANRIKGITVEIGGDTTKLQTALKGVNGQIKNTQSALRDVEKLLKLDPHNTELLSQKQKLLTQAIGETKEKLATLKTAAEQANEQLQKGEITQEQYDALQREIIETEAELKRLEQQASTTNATLTKIGDVGSKLESVGNGITNVGKKVSVVSAAVTGMGIASVKTAADFESSMSQVQATMGITKDSMSNVNGESVNTMEALSDLAKQMGSETAFSASECAEALNYLALAGYDTQEMVDTLPTVLNLAAAGNIDLASASDMVTDAMSALGMETSEADTMVDQMAKTASSTNTSVSQLGEGILTIGATAKSIKGGTAELNTALGILANNGIKGAEGGTHLRNVILSLQNPTDKAAACMEQLGVNVYDSQGNMRSLNDILGDLNTSMEGMTSAEKTNIISSIFNKTDLSSVNALLANTGETWDSLQNSITNSAGAAQQMADTRLDNLSGQLTILKSALEGLAISIGEALMPMVKNIVSKIQGFVTWLNNLEKGIFLSIWNFIVNSFTNIMNVLRGVADVVLGWFGTSWNEVWTGIRDFFVNLWTGIVDFFTGLWEGIKNTVQTAIMFIASILEAAFDIITLPFRFIWENCKEIIIAVWDAIKEKVSGAINAISTVVSTVMNAIKTVFTTVWNAIKTHVTTVVNAVKTVVTTVFNAIKSVATTVWTGIKTAITTVVDGIKSKVSSVFNSVKSTVSSVFNGIKSTATSVWNGIKSAITTPIEAAKNKVKSVVDAIKGFFSGMKISLPHIKLPHFKVTGSLSIAPPSVPHLSIDWYKNGGIMNRPTIFGMNGSSLMAGGEAGQEAILPLSGFYKQLEGMLDSKMNTAGMERYLAIIADNSSKGIYLEDGTLVGRLLPAIDNGLGKQQKLSRRLAL